MSTPTVLTRLDPSLPLCWENPDTLRAGFDRALARVTAPSAAQQRFIALLREGVPSRSLTEAAGMCGVSESERLHLLDQLAPVLVPVVRPGRDRAVRAEAPEPPGDARRVRVHGGGVGGAALEAAALRAGFVVERGATGLGSGGGSAPIPDAGARGSGSRRTRRGRPAPPPAPEAVAVLVVERFIAPPAALRRAGTETLPQLFVRFSDRSASVGPIVLPDAGPCRSCLLLAEVEQDPAALMLAAQLLEADPASETPPAAEAISTLALTLLQRWLRGDEAAPTIRARLEVEGGLPALSPRIQRCEAHPECACARLGPAAQSTKPAGIGR